MAAFICNGQKNHASSCYEAMALSQARQSYNETGTGQSFLNRFPTVGVICIIKAEGRPYPTSGKHRVLIPQNCRNIPECETLKIFQGTHIFPICQTFQLKKKNTILCTDFP